VSMGVGQVERQLAVVLQGAGQFMITRRRRTSILLL
jgi:hypothetical protein